MVITIKVSRGLEFKFQYFNNLCNLSKKRKKEEKKKKKRKRKKMNDEMNSRYRERLIF